MTNNVYKKHKIKKSYSVLETHQRTMAIPLSEERDCLQGHMSHNFNSESFLKFQAILDVGI